MNASPPLCISLSCESDALVALLDELSALMESASPESRQAFAEAVDGAGGLSELIVVDSKTRATEAGELVVTCKPSQRFLDLAAAFRAANGCEH